MHTYIQMIQNIGLPFDFMSATGILNLLIPYLYVSV